MSAANATRTAAARTPYKFKIMSRWLAFGASWPLPEREEGGAKEARRGSGTPAFCDETTSFLNVFTAKLYALLFARP